MKCAIYIEDGITQLVLTPTTKWEKEIVDSIPAEAVTQIKRGDFYECRGGWMRHGQGGESSLMLVLRPETVAEPSMPEGSVSP